MKEIMKDVIRLEIVFYNKVIFLIYLKEALKLIGAILIDDNSLKNELSENDFSNLEKVDIS